ncbi:MAG: helix-turn-helix domain-containing protein [Rhodospirillaceae bacterium]|jgi:DNA-binding IclR family transcriptional regulator|nr:helix-turn-helix domain-containing protein [Rhodospirillaceae bacterium]MBT5240187.1 helix-turn-helix domain-containing protein [Rhodospirillaceae bacterium]MBT5566966.1 helix-turn-helix domain-containing protein [Rhodospirillaceae bacterium]MBT6090347.1 helix-turn-helix domain-containing protein [Rhodospirillaceae bacterium]MBT6960538.1 helix-turn-helix domain-containing protein [Rhodospirillaceae bacterium]
MNDGLEKPPETAGVIKSASRTLAVLEAFQNWKRPAGAREIARTLEMPRSSANALLASLVTLGYLWFEPKNATYFPTLKVGLLGDWLIGSIRRDRALSSILQEISAATGETVSLVMRTGFDMQLVTIVPSTFPIALNIEEGALAPLFESAVGIAWIAAQNIGEIEDLVVAHNKRPGVTQVAPLDLKKRISEVAAKGAAVAYDKVLPDTGAIALAFPRPVQGQTIVIGLGGPHERIRRSEKQIIALIRRLVRQTLG